MPQSESEAIKIYECTKELSIRRDEPTGDGEKGGQKDGVREEVSCIDASH